MHRILSGGSKESISGSAKKREFLEATQKNLIELLGTSPPIAEIFHSRLWEELKLYYFIGGMPEVVQTYLNLQSESYDAFARVRELQTRLIAG